MIAFFPKPLKVKELRQRGAALIEVLEELTERAQQSRWSLMDRQSVELVKLLHYAYDFIPFYRKKYDAVGFDPDRVKGLDDLALIPETTKEELRRAAKEDLLPLESSGPLRFLMTSGSTGTPVALYKTESSLVSFSAYSMLLYYEWCRGNPFSNVLYLLDSKPHNIDYAVADLLRTTVMEERIISTFEPVATMADKLDEFRPRFISSYPSTMRNLALHLLNLDRTNPEVRLIHVTSEMLDPTTRNLMARAFPQADVIETYTSTEAGMMGFQCSPDGELHLTEDCAIYEILDELGAPTDSTGRLVVTDLVNWGTPIIRYSGLGDLVSRSHARCRCGREFLTVSHLEGRVVDSVRLRDGATISPYTLTNILAEMPGIACYQIIQHEMDGFEVKVVKDRNPTFSQEALIRQVRTGFCKVLGDGVQCDVNFLDEIRPEPNSHKIPLVKSKVSYPS